MKIASHGVLAALALVASAVTAAERFRPAAESVVLTVTKEIDDPRDAVQRASLYLQRARQTGEPRYFTRAEALLRPWITAPAAPAALLNLQADILQNRHDFAGAREVLDRAVRQDPRNAASRLLRATVNAVQGRFDQARPDCAAVIALGEAIAGSACLAQVLGATGRLDEAQTLLRSVADRQSDSNAMRAWMFALQADFADRRGEGLAAERSLRQALEIEPYNEAVRTALCDRLLDRRATAEALALLDVPNPSYGLLVRKARAQALRHDPALRRTLERLAEITQLTERRGDIPHLREQALLALDVERDEERALVLAKANFAMQRETIDVRLLARAALARQDRATLAELRQWRQSTGWEDRSL